jgi:hypothetical protein
MALKAQELRPVMVRIPENLRRRLERTAAANHRSMNTEIIFRLELSFIVDETKIEERLSANEKAVAELMQLVRSGKGRRSIAEITDELEKVLRPEKGRDKK